MASKVISIQPSGDAVRQHLERMLADPEFAHSERMSRFLRFVVTQTLAGNSEMLKESVIGVHVFDRDPAYDPKADPVVRGEARRLRSKLLEYSHNHPNDPLWIDLPKGGYVPEFRWRPAGASGHPEVKVQSPSVDAPAKGPTWDRRHVVAIAAIAVIVVVTVLIVSLLWQRAPSYSVLDARPLTTFPGYQASPAFSPDGEKIAFSWGGPKNEKTSIWMLLAPGAAPRQMSQSPTEDTRPVWSPDGRQLAFLRKLDRNRVAIYTTEVSTLREKKIVEVISTTTGVGRVEWSPDGKYLLSSEQDSLESASALTLISITNGSKTRLTAPDPHTSGDTDAVFSPDGHSIAFRRTIGPAVEDLYIASVDPGALGQTVRQDRIKRVTFDNESIGGHAWTPDGRSIILASKRGGGSYGLWRIPLSGGTATRLTQADIVAVHPAISKRGDRLAYESVVNDSNIWELNLQSNGPARVVVASTMLDTSPQYSPDGTRIAFRSSRSGSDEVWVADAASGQAHQITHYSGPLTGSPRWSPDGRQLAFDSRRAANADIYIVPADGGTARRFTTEPSSDVVPSWSRDGKSIYFASDRSGKWQVWRQLVAAGAAQQVTTNGGFAAFESADGKYVYFSKGSPEGGLWKVPDSGGAETNVVPRLSGRMWGNWAVGVHGIYYLEYLSAPPSLAAIQFFDFATESTREVGRTTGYPMAWDSGLAVSSDERKLLFAQVDRAGSNIYIAEHFQ